MLPLGTPTTSGPWADWISLALVAGGLGAFALGLADLCRRVAPRAGTLDAVTRSAYAALALVGLSVSVMLAGGRGIPVAQAVFLAVAAWGVVCAAAHLPSSWRRVRTLGTADIWRTAVCVLAALYSVWFWADLFGDHIGLPVAHDGIAHTAWYLRILEAGVPTLGRVPIGFKDIFGVQRFEFYPTGTHALIAITSGFWGQWGVMSQAAVLKAWFTLAMAALPWSLAFVVRRLLPRVPWWMGVALALGVMPGFRFPVEAAHEGGASRIFAHALMAPLYADIVLGRFASPRRWPLAGLVLGIAFLMHPSAFVTVSALLAYAAFWAALEDTDWRQRAVRLGTCLLGLALGAGLAAGVLMWNGGVAAARDAAVAFSWAAWVARLALAWTTLFLPDYGMGLVKGLLIGAGLAMLALRRKALGVPARVGALPFWMALVVLLGVSALVVPFPGSRMVGGAFYDEVPRVIEVLYEAIGLCLAAAGLAFWDVLRPYRDVRHVGAIVSTALVVAGLGLSLTSRPWLGRHFGYWDRVFQTARTSRLQALGTWIENHTEPDAILFHVPFDTEIWEAWTGRRSIFMYGECHVNNYQLPCNRRKDMVIAQAGALRDRLVQATPDEPCLRGIAAFHRPAYFLLTTPFSSSGPFAVCSDARYVTTLDGKAVIAYRRTP